MADSITIFQEEHPSLESYYRSVILFGRNTASYKFALSKALLDIAPTGKNDVTLDELAVPFAKYVCEHVAHSPKQQSAAKSPFVEACKQFNEGTISSEKLRDMTLSNPFRYVIDAFHVVNQGSIPVQFYQKDYQGRSKKIVLTDELFKLAEIKGYDSLENETESRWRLVETAWALGISRNLLKVQYDQQENELFVKTDEFRRINITSARGALNGYQKGKCFYCFDDISIQSDDENLCDVDHFFPHMLQPMVPDVNLDGVWNLVLACPNCNRGQNGKFERIPVIKYLERLHKRNEFLISSHHPLRETLINQTGATTQNRVNFLQNMDRIAINYVLHRWETDLIGEEVF